MSLSFGLEDFKDGPAHFVDHFRQRLGGIDVNDESIIAFLDVVLLKAMANQVRFSVPSWRNQCNIVAVLQPCGDVLRFLNTVTEILRANITICNKRVYHICFLFLRCKYTHFVIK